MFFLYEQSIHIPSLIALEVIKSALKCKWKQRWKFASNVLFRLFVLLFLFQRTFFPGRKKVLKGCYPSLHRFRLPPIFFVPFLLLCPVRWFLYMFIEHTHTRSKNSLSSTNVEREKRSKYFFINPNEKKKYSLVHCSFQFHHDEWNAHTITRFLLYVVVTIIFRELSVIYIYMNTLFDIEHWFNMNKTTSPLSYRFMLR